VENGAPLPLGPPKQRALLALLLIHANEVLSVARIIDALWGEEPPEGGAKTLWVFTPSANRWEGTPILMDTPDADGSDDWVYGLDVHGDQVAVSIREGLWIGTFRSATD